MSEKWRQCGFFTKILIKKENNIAKELLVLYNEEWKIPLRSKKMLFNSYIFILFFYR